MSAAVPYELISGKELRRVVVYLPDGTAAGGDVVPAAADSVLTTLQAAAAAVADGTAVNLKGYKGLTVELTGTFVATVTFEATIDDASWFAVGLKTAADGAAVTSATAPGAWKLPQDVALSQFRARVSAFTSGTVTVKGRRHAR